MRRAKNLSDEDIASIVGILDGWSGRLTWQSLLDAVERHLFTRYTRQALHKHTRIQQAFEQRKAGLAAQGGHLRQVKAVPEMQIAMDRILRLEAELERVYRENNCLLEQFVRWSYNASLRGLDAEYLNSPLPSLKGIDSRGRPPDSVGSFSSKKS